MSGHNSCIIYLSFVVYSRHWRDDGSRGIHNQIVKRASIVLNSSSSRSFLGISTPLRMPGRNISLSLRVQVQVKGRTISRPY